MALGVELVELERPALAMCGVGFDRDGTPELPEAEEAVKRDRTPQEIRKPGNHPDKLGRDLGCQRRIIAVQIPLRSGVARKRVYLIAQGGGPQRAGQRALVNGFKDQGNSFRIGVVLGDQKERDTNGRP